MEKCQLCGGRGFVITSAVPLSHTVREQIGEEMATLDGRTPLFESGIQPVPCPVCTTVPVRARFWAAALAGDLARDGCLDANLTAAVARSAGDALWKLWKKRTGQKPAADPKAQP